MVNVRLITLLAITSVDFLVSKRLTETRLLQAKENLTEVSPPGRGHVGGHDYQPNRGGGRSSGSGRSRSHSHDRGGDDRRRRWFEYRRGGAPGGEEHRNRSGDMRQGLESLIGELLSDVFAAIGPDEGLGEFEPDGNQERPPATAEAFLRDMPVLKVTENDVEAEDDECSICVDKLFVGDPALRIPCGHLFHEDCIRKWLRSSNKCPICRYELPTDDADFETGRLERMNDRRPRLRAKDLARRSIGELHQLADLLGVDTEGCLEKQDLADAIVGSGRVDIIPVDTIPAVSKTPSLGSASISETE